MDFTKEDIANGSNISRASLFNYWNELEKHSIVKVTKSVGKMKLYTLNTKSNVVKRILELEKALISEVLEKDMKKELLVSA